MNLASLLVSIVSVVLSTIALGLAGSARKMVSKMVGRSNDQKDAELLRKTINKLQDAKSAAKGRRRSASPYVRAGWTEAQDRQLLFDAQDALATELPTCLSPTASSSASAAAVELQVALQDIAKQGARDGWADAHVALQQVIRALQTEQRRLDNAILSIN